MRWRINRKAKKELKKMEKEWITTFKCREKNEKHILRVAEILRSCGFVGLFQVRVSYANYTCYLRFPNNYQFSIMTLQDDAEPNIAKATKNIMNGWNTESFSGCYVKSVVNAWSIYWMDPNSLSITDKIVIDEPKITISRELIHQDLDNVSKAYVENEVAVEIDNSIRYNDYARISLGIYLNAVVGIENLGKLLQLKIVTDELKFIDDKNKILNYDMFSDLLTKPYDLSIFETEIAKYSVTLILTHLPANAQMYETLTITINYEGETNTTFYFRITYTKQPNRINNTYDVGDNQASSPRSISTMVAYDKVNVDDKIAEFRFMVGDAKDKIESGRVDELTDIQKYAYDCCRLDINENAYYGKKLFTSKRYIEALPYLQSVRRKMQSRFLNFNEDESAVFNEILYMIGFCYCEFNQYEKAYYYLSFANGKTTDDFINYGSETINSLSNDGDIRAIICNNDYLEKTAELIDSDDITEEDKKKLSRFKIFLLRRFAYNSINHGYYNDAEETLKQLLNDPESESFALRELNYLKGLRGKE